MDSTAASLVLVPLLAVAAAFIASQVGRVAKIPLVVFEIVLGIIVGPSLLGWVEPTEFISMLADLGLALLFFMAGNEIDFAAITGRPLKRAGLGWVVSLAAGITVGVVVAQDVATGVIIGIALSSTALGTLMPMLRDAGELSTIFGRTVTAIGAVGEFGPLLAISILLSSRAPLAATIVLFIFIAMAAAAVLLAWRGTHRGLHKLIATTLHTSGQFAIRVTLLLIGGLVALSIVFGLDILLGALAAGMLWRALLREAPAADRHVVEMKLDGIAFGFLVPVFFINTGITFNLVALVSDPTALALVPAFLILLLVVRGLPGLLALPVGSDSGTKRAVVLFGATGLPIIVAVTNIGTENGVLSSGTGAALVGAGMLTVLIFPALALAQRRNQRGGGAVSLREPLI